MFPACSNDGAITSYRNCCAELGTSLQQQLNDKFGQRTVPQVYISGELLGGADETFEAYNQGELQQRLSDAGLSGGN